MKKVAILCLAVLFVVSAAGCFGPNKLTRQYDDWLNQQYVDSPWLVANVVSAVFVGIGFVVTNLVDGLVLNPIDFWGTSAFRGWGTAFNHKNPTMPGKK